MKQLLIAAVLVFPWSLAGAGAYLWWDRWWHRRHCTRPLICRVCNRKEISRV